MRHKSFYIHSDYFNELRLLSAEQRGMVMLAFMNLTCGIDLPEMDPLCAMLFRLMVEQKERISNIRSESGSNGGAPIGNQNAKKQAESSVINTPETSKTTKTTKTSKNDQKQPKQAETTKNNQKQAKQTTVSLSLSLSDTDNRSRSSITSRARARKDGNDDDNDDFSVLDLSPEERTKISAETEACLEAGKAIGLDPKCDCDLLDSLIAEFSAPWVLEAIKRAREAPKEAHCIRYIRGILREFKAHGGPDSPTKARDSPRVGKRVSEQNYNQRVYTDAELDALALPLLSDDYAFNDSA